MSSAKSSPSPSPELAGVEMKRRDTNGSIKDGTSSLKRVREGSLEPTQAEASIPEPVATKKNRIASSSKSAQGPNDTVDAGIEEIDSPPQNVDGETEPSNATRKEERPVGEVRKKVEKMTYDEKRLSNPPEEAADNGQGENVTVDEDRPGGGGDDSWENIEKDEIDLPNGEKLKRKALDRSESSFAQETGDVSAKRAKDIILDSAPEEVKPDTIPPPAKKPPSTFSSFASSASPFAALKSPSPAPDLNHSASATDSPPIPPSVAAKKPQATFGAFSSAAASPFASAVSPASAASTPKSPAARETTTAPTKKPQATFGAFSSSSSSSSSAFGAAKPASTFGSAPVKGSAFGNYSTTSSAFSSKKNEPVEGQKIEAGPSSFGDILKDSGNDEMTEEKLEMQEQDVTTGEEEEETVIQTRAKLYTNEKSSGWKERGVGLLKLNVRRSDGSGARLLMRADGVLRLILNFKLYKGLFLSLDGKIIRMTVPEDDKFIIICLRMSNPKITSELAEIIREHIPLEGESKASEPSAV
ncbi:uncharacterized protein IL334_001472 [Kwoniella shivajii]|uniref:RanBD1 domain-containing protein n=1 Tax=Kwoniella shivajii TaxID=564305 RepID=A0ABZ1CS31_9TREE|nr:hypothetical protein IL334_001472 [Kwoniella shivajii]